MSGRGAALGDPAQRLLEDGGDPPRLVAGGGVVVHLLDAPAVPLPPLVAVEELLGHLLADGAADEQVLGAVGLGGLREDARASVAHELVHRPPQGGVGGDAGVAVGAAAVGGDRDLGDGLARAPRLVGPGQQTRHLRDRPLHRLADAPALLDGHDGRPAVRGQGQGHALALDHDPGLVDLAAEADDDVGGHVGVPGVAGQHPLEGQVVLARPPRSAQPDLWVIAITPSTLG